jgi:hypothetical protein
MYDCNRILDITIILLFLSIDWILFLRLLQSLVPVYNYPDGVISRATISVRVPLPPLHANQLVCHDLRAKRAIRKHDVRGSQNCGKQSK